jgi:multiple sugar transport system substrate-binding protein
MVMPILPSFMLLSWLLASALAGCTEQSASIPAGSDRVTVVFKHGKLSGNGRLDGLLKEFERTHPGIAVHEEMLPASTDQQHQFYAINLEGRSASFDVMAADTVWVQEFARAGWITELDVLTEEERERYFPATIAAATFRNRLYAAPWYIDAGILYFRRDLLERYGLPVPRTWPELARTARTVLDGEHDPALQGFVWQGKQNEGMVCAALEFIWSHGADLTVERSPDAEAALGFMRRLIADDRVSPATTVTADEETTRHLFGAGRAVFMRNWPYAWWLYQRQGSPVSGRIGVAALPAFPDHEPVSALGGWMLAVPKGAAHPREAAELVRFLSTRESQRWMALELGYRPARRDLYDDPELRQKDRIMDQLYPIFSAAKPRPVTPYYLMLSQVLQPEFSAVLVGTKSPREALASARWQMEQIVTMPKHEGGA